MRLKSIKLAGFKSFADPTTIHFPPDLCCVVGPIGCGKSNLIDAVRWVMGENSAKSLRIDNMTEVIFGGTRGRQPVGQASVELLFENHDQRLSGEYANFSEVSVRRKADRDGSTYFLNGTRVRRKDITDIFLGTGLGARSYSIIEQGMVSRLVESRPEELRAYIEEAAGISRYKDRRREAENRIERTRENLASLTELREELERQLSSLKRQSVAAEKHNELQQRRRQTRARLDALQWQSLQAEIDGHQHRADELQARLQAHIEQLQTVENDINTLRAGHADLTAVREEKQRHCDGIDHDIARLNDAIRNDTGQVAQWQEELARLRTDREQTQQELDKGLVGITQLEDELKRMEPGLAQARAEEKATAQQLEKAESAQHHWQQQWNEFDRQARQPRQIAEAERVRIQQLQSSMERGLERKQRLEQEQQKLAAVPAEDGADALSCEISAAETDLESLKQSAAQHSSKLEEHRQAIEQCQLELDHVTGELQQEQVRQASLQALQQAALGQDNPELNQWLRCNGFDRLSRLAEGLKIAPGWELAVELVLGDFLQALCVEGMDRLGQLLPTLPRGKLTVVDVAASAAAPRPDGRLPGLDSRIASDWPLAGLLADILTTDDLQQALAHRDSLAWTQSIVTRDGFWLGVNWIRAAPASDQDSVIERREWIAESLARIQSLEQQCTALQQHRESLQARLAATEAARDNCQQLLADQSGLLGTLRARHGAEVATTEARAKRQQQLTLDFAELTRQLAAERQDLAQARLRLQQAEDGMARDADEQQQLEAAGGRVQDDLARYRDKSGQDKDRVHALQLDQRELQYQLKSTREAVDRKASELRDSRQRMEYLDDRITQSAGPLEAMGQQREQLLQARLAAEQELEVIKDQLGGNGDSVRELEQSRHQEQEEIQSTREAATQIRIKVTEAQTRQGLLSEQIRQAGFDPDQVVGELPTGLAAAACEQSLEKIDRRIRRLGEINHAAIADYQRESGRKLELDGQIEELEGALERLQTVIRQINRDTRTRFKETFDKIDAGLQTLFPLLFDGGRAYLDMTGEDLLDTGVTIMAQPPGKRNSSIQRLSGGEKSMTAIALVFSIFHLNPSPFCMLDEVDAPLDDHNTRRYIRLVREMSANLQFVLVTHNKITMEMSSKLLGVTMDEPGVSRIVAVDIDEIS